MPKQTSFESDYSENDYLDSDFELSDYSDYESYEPFEGDYTVSAIDPSDAPILSSEDLVEIELDSTNSSSLDGGEVFDLGTIETDFAGYVVQDLTTNSSVDIYQFTVGQGDDLNFILDGLTDDADLYLLSEDLEVLGASDNAGIEAEVLAGNLEEGTYYLGISSYEGSPTDYELTIASGDFALASAEVDYSSEFGT
jgi:hypothetical protein